MLFNVKKSKIFLLFYLLMTFPAKSNENIEFKVKNFKLDIDRSRVIINNKERGAFITIENSHDYPILVQTRIIDMDLKNKSKSFIATPPLFRLNEGQNSKVRIYKKNIDNLPIDRESMFWVCVKGIPPTEKDLWAKDKSDVNKTILGVNFAVENCIKLFYRPKEVQSVNFESGKELNWFIKNGKLSVKNPTSNYLNLNKLIVGDVEIKETGFVPPFSEKEYNIKVSVGENIKWNIITDLGGEGKIYHEAIK